MAILITPNGAVVVADKPSLLPPTLASNQPAMASDGGALSHLTNLGDLSGVPLQLPAGAATADKQPTVLFDGSAMAYISNLQAVIDVLVSLVTKQPAVVTPGSPTAGQTGTLALGAVTAAAPSYTDGTTMPPSLTPAGNLRVDGSSVTQPVMVSNIADAQMSRNDGRRDLLARAQFEASMGGPAGFVPVEVPSFLTGG